MAIVKSEPKLQQTRKDLPFDQYSRQYIVSELINYSARKSIKSSSLSIIDLGGHKGKTTQFHPNDKVTVLDIYDDKYEGYIKGDATNMVFKDDAFDIACSFDVFEHIPREKRQAFIDEALRVSKYGIFIAMPIDTNGLVSEAELLLNNFHKGVFNKDHQWLKEHIDYKIPTQKEIEALIKNSNGYHANIISNQIGDWQIMQMLLITSAKNHQTTQIVQDINKWYNQNILFLDSFVDVGYRMIFFITKKPENLKEVQVAIDKLKNFKQDHQLVTIHKDLFKKFSITFSQVSKNYNQLLSEYERNISEYERNIKNIEKLNYKYKTLCEHLEILEIENNLMRGSLSWRLTKPLRSLKNQLSSPLNRKTKK